MRQLCNAAVSASSLEGRPLVMGILNVTPDSFSDGGRYQALEFAMERAEQMIKDGVDMIDIGGESTRPGSPSVPVEEELRRVMPAVYALRELGRALSVDTCKPLVMREAIIAGADMINDINGFRAPGAIEAVKDSDCGLCVMHMQGTPQDMQAQPVTMTWWRR
jgi:dihydropteroate synthase